MPARRMVIVTPTRNEARSAPLVMAELSSAIEVLRVDGWDVSMLVIDDQSIDDTGDVIRSEAAIRNIEVHIHQGPGSGLSRALTMGLRLALDLNPAIIATFDFDGQHDASQLPLLVSVWEKSDGAAAVFGSRFATGASVTGVRGFRKLISHAAQWAVRWASAGPDVPSDSTTSLRIFTPAVADGFLREVPSTGLDGYRLFSWFAVFTSCRFSFAEVPIDFRPRLTGVSKLRVADLVSFAVGLRSLRGVSRDWVRQERQAQLFPIGSQSAFPGPAMDDRHEEWVIGNFAKELHGHVAIVGAQTATIARTIVALAAVGRVTLVESSEQHVQVLTGDLATADDVEVVSGTPPMCR